MLSKITSLTLIFGAAVLLQLHLVDCANKCYDTECNGDGCTQGPSLGKISECTPPKEGEKNVCYARGYAGTDGKQKYSRGCNSKPKDQEDKCTKESDIKWECYCNADTCNNSDNGRQ